MANVICTSAMCSKARASVVEMRNTFESMPVELQPRFQPTVQTIQNSLAETISPWSELIPFNPACCAAADIGAQADDVNAQMLAAMHAAGVGPGPSTQPPPIDLGGLLTAGLIIAGIAVLAPLVKKARA